MANTLENLTKTVNSLSHERRHLQGRGLRGTKLYKEVDKQYQQAKTQLEELEAKIDNQLFPQPYEEIVSDPIKPQDVQNSLDIHDPVRKPKQIQNVLRDLPESAADRKDVPLFTGCIDYFPLALAEVARISKAGNDQHNPGQPLHWARNKSLDHVDCVGRHLVQRGTLDTDGKRHTAKAAWRVLALLQEELEREAGWTPEVDD